MPSWNRTGPDNPFKWNQGKDNAMPNITHQNLLKLGTAIFRGMGTPEDIAEKVAGSLVKGSLAGMDSHGILQIIRYAEKIKSETLKPDARPHREILGPSAGIIYGNFGFGQITAYAGVEWAMEMARESGVSTVALREVNHVGRLGEYAEWLARQDIVGLIMASGGDKGGQVAPYGGSQRIFGTNPIAWGIPTPPEFQPIVVDFATASVAMGKVLLASKTGQKVLPGSLIDKNGDFTTDPMDYFSDGAILPFGDHKGYGLMFVIEILATLFGGCAPLSSVHHKKGNPVVVTAWDPVRFVDLDMFKSKVGELCARVKSTLPASTFSEVFLPGELEERKRKKRLKEGIPVPDEVWKELIHLKKQYVTD